MMLTLPIKFGVRGEIRWFAYDPDGNRIPVKTTDGREVWGGHVQKNLITNLALDAMASQDRGWAAAQGIDGTNYNLGLRRTLHVGTGSTAPAFTDTALVAEAQSSVSTGGFTATAIGNESEDFAGTPPTLTAKAVVNHVVTMTANRNLTEYGYSDANAAALNIRELFRDETDTPITISLLTGTKLRIEHTWYTTFDLSRTTSTFTIESYDVSGALVATDNITAEWGLSHIVDTSSPSASAGSMLTTISRTLVTPIQQTIGSLGFYASANPVIQTVFEQDSTAITTGVTNIGFSLSWDAYVPGSHETTMRINVNEPNGNMTLYGWRYGYGTSSFGRYGHTFNVCFRSGASFVKADTHTFQVGIVGTWARA